MIGRLVDWLGLEYDETASVKIDSIYSYLLEDSTDLNFTDLLNRIVYGSPLLGSTIHDFGVIDAICTVVQRFSLYKGISPQNTVKMYKHCRFS